MSTAAGQKGVAPGRPHPGQAERLSSGGDRVPQCRPSSASRDPLRAAGLDLGDGRQIVGVVGEVRALEAIQSPAAQLLAGMPARPWATAAPLPGDDDVAAPGERSAAVSALGEALGHQHRLRSSGASGTAERRRWGRRPPRSRPPLRDVRPHRGMSQAHIPQHIPRRKLLQDQALSSNCGMLRDVIHPPSRVRRHARAVGIYLDTCARAGTHTHAPARVGENPPQDPALRRKSSRSLTLHRG